MTKFETLFLRHHFSKLVPEKFGSDSTIFSMKVRVSEFTEWKSTINSPVVPGVSKVLGDQVHQDHDSFDVFSAIGTLGQYGWEVKSIQDHTDFTDYLFQKPIQE